MPTPPMIFDPRELALELREAIHKSAGEYTVTIPACCEDCDMETEVDISGDELLKRVALNLILSRNKVAEALGRELGYLRTTPATQLANQEA